MALKIVGDGSHEMFWKVAKGEVVALKYDASVLFNLRPSIDAKATPSQVANWVRYMLGMAAR